jgi:hypothetical protein
MKSILFGCFVGILSLMILSAVRAQTEPLPPPADSQILVEATVEPIATGEASLEPEIEISITETGTLISPTETEALIVSVEPSSEVTAETGVSPVVTESVVILSPSDAVVATLSSETFTPTITPTLAVRSIEGQALYPNRVLGQAFIRVQTFAPDHTLLSTSYTDANGLYAVIGLSDQVTLIEIDAPLHLPETLYIAPGMMPYSITLRAGDLDGDLCVGPTDIEILRHHYGQAFIGADLDGSGLVDVIDLTLLSGNYDASCVPSVMIPPTPGAVTTAEIDTNVTLEETPVPTEALTTAEISPTPTAEISPEPDAPTESPVSLDIEATLEATALVEESLK